MSNQSSGFIVGVYVGLVAMGILETCIPGIGWHNAAKSKEACEKSLPRDQVCIANYVPAQGEHHER